MPRQPEGPSRNSTPQAVKGTRDLFGAELALHRHIEATAARWLEAAGALEIETPIFEESQVFEKGVGPASDIVRKEMYTFQDRGERWLTLRPEGTASVVRAYLEHGMKVWPAPVKLWLRGSMFRAENPQKGRLRQFHQVGYEVLGSREASLDAETIALMWGIFTDLGLKGLELKLGSVGDPADRLRYNTYLRELLAPYRERLSENSRERLALNPMRIWDAKDPEDLGLLAELSPAPMLESLGPAAREHLQALEADLKALGIPYQLDPKMVRGLDYYSRTAFEIHHSQIGSQSALGGGGRYDGLAELLGGGPVPAVGFAFGLERVALALGAPETPARVLDLYLIPMDELAVREALVLAAGLRPRFHVEQSYAAKKPRKGLEEALKRGARFAAFLGERERNSGSITVRNLAQNQERSWAKDHLEAALTDWDNV